MVERLLFIPFGRYGIVCVDHIEQMTHLKTKLTSKMRLDENRWLRLGGFDWSRRN